MHTTQVGDIAEAHVLAALIGAGYGALVPFSSNSRYDVVAEMGGKFSRIQVKNGVVKNNAVVFRTFSTRGSGKKRVAESYHGQIDYFGVYCRELDSVYLVPIDKTSAKGGECRLRLQAPKSGRTVGIRWASDYLL